MLSSKNVVVWEGSCDGCGREFRGDKPPSDWIELSGKWIPDSTRAVTYGFCPVCREAIGKALERTRKNYEEPLADWERELLGEPAALGTDVEPEPHKHEWRWSNTRWADRITRRYCVGCGVLFTDL